MFRSPTPTELKPASLDQWIQQIQWIQFADDVTLTVPTRSAQMKWFIQKKKQWDSVLELATRKTQEGLKRRQEQKMEGHNYWWRPYFSKIRQHIPDTGQDSASGEAHGINNIVKYSARLGLEQMCWLQWKWKCLVLPLSQELQPSFNNKNIRSCGLKLKIIWKQILWGIHDACPVLPAFTFLGCLGKHLQSS